MANKKTGYAFIYRSLLEHWLWTSDEPFDTRSAWVDLLLTVNHKENTIFLNGNTITIKPGQKWTSIGNLAKRWHWSENRVRRYLNVLTKEHMITYSGTPRGTLITIVNWANFATPWRTDGRTDGRTDERADGRTDGRQTIMINNDKEYKEAPSAEASPSFPWRENK